MEKESNKKVTVISLFLALVCIAILGFIIYFKVNKKNEDIKENVETIEKIKTETEETKEEEKEEVQDKELINNLYSIIGDNPELREEEPVDYETLSENVRDSIVLNILNDECQETITYDKGIFEAKYKEIYNQDKINDDGLCKLDGANYECTRYCNEFGERIFANFKNSETLDDSIIIYEEAGHIDYADDGKVYLKESAIDSTAIASFETLDDLKNSEVQYKLPMYKHVFAKGEDNNYYWVSSESVKQ